MGEIAIDGWSFAVDGFLSLSKGFNCVDYSILLIKLSYYGIEGKLLEWFSSYLMEW